MDTVTELVNSLRLGDEKGSLRFTGKSSITVRAGCRFWLSLHFDQVFGPSTVQLLRNLNLIEKAELIVFDMGDIRSLLSKDSKIKVSSTLDKSVGKKYLTDGSQETCWTSQQGLPQYIQITFDAPVIPRTVHITFQGGFVGKRCSIYVRRVKNESGVSETAETKVEGSDTPSPLVPLTVVYPEDVNRKQSFNLFGDPNHTPIDQMKLVFEDSSDFFGRITVYDLQVEGSIVEGSTQP